MSHIKISFFIFVLAIFLAGCEFQTTPTTGVGIPQSIPTPKKDLGVVVGKLLTPNVNGAPYLATIYLAQTLQANQTDFPPMLAFSEKSNPKATQDSTGQFIFSDVPPGTYALIIWTPISSTPILDPNNTNNYFLFRALAGKVTNLGLIVIP